MPPCHAAATQVPWGGVYRAIQREDMVLEAPVGESCIVYSSSAARGTKLID